MVVHCPSCQAPLLDEARFCLECGAAIRPSSHPGSAETTPAPVVPRATPGEGEMLPAEPATEDYSERQLDGASPVVSGLNPTRDYLLELQRGGRFQPWELRRPYYSVGRQGTKITLTDPHVSRRHLAVVRVGTDWLAINLSDKRLRVNGWVVRQKTLRPGDVLRIGHTWLVFAASALPRPSAPSRPMAGAWQDMGVPSGRAAVGAGLPSVPQRDGEETARLTLVASGRPAGSTSGQPLLAGSHPLCGVPLAGAGVAPFHCLFSWMPDGPHFVDLGGGVLLGGAPMNQGRLHDGHTLAFGGQVLTVCLSGDLCAPAAERLRLARVTTPAVSLTVIYGPHRGETAVLPPGRPVILGHAAGADLHLPKDADYVPPRLEVYLEPSKKDARRPLVRLRELEVSRGVVVNRRPLFASGTMRLGDVLQFGPPKAVGPTALLLHNDLRLDAW